MPVKVLTDAFIYVSGHDFSGESNQVRLTADAVNHDVTTLRSNGWNEGVMGLKSSSLDASGFWSTANDGILVPNLGTGDQVHTVGPSETEGGRCYVWQAGHFTASLLGVEVGGVAPYSLQSRGTDGVGIVSTRLIKKMGTVTQTGATGTVVELGAAASGQHLYAVFHVFTAGTTITAELESDADDDFDGSETTRVTFGPITTTGGTWATRVAGPITDTHYRLNVSAITGSFVIACAAGIQ